ncbi:mucin-2-like [Pectinophora gossypiella]|uniref:mucin-2-like n=1 Tax=Pectinophora gossypiella TaxID=13191 RepID=UPI00214EFD50|nr:mucin-2-like [Pectinophora gossypiella]
MEHVSRTSLLFITLLQLCRAELSGSWYSANVINDGDFSPKPISEIFTTQTSFSTRNPIVVLPSSTVSPTLGSTSLSTPATSFSTSITPEDYVSSTPSTLPTQSSFMPPTHETFMPSTQQTFIPSTQGTFMPSTFPQPKPDYDLRQPFQFSLTQEKQPNPPNYFLIYQQAPQTLQSLPPSAPQQTFSTFEPSSTFRPEISTPQTTLSTLQSEISSLQTTFSTMQPEISTLSSTLSTMRPPTTLQSTFSTFQPSSESTFPSNLPSSVTPTRTRSMPTSTMSPDVPRSTRTTFPCVTTGRPTPGSVPPRFPSFRIRMVAPKGSITNIHINPPTTTTRPIVRSTTTRKPSTTRTRRTKRNRNNFDGCVNSCGGKKPICATPLAVTPINPDQLKGFPSICHMACHNSFKKDQYEMLVEGRCGRLRTRIRTVDSEKLKKGELNKVRYTLDNPQTVVEFSSLPR